MTLENLSEKEVKGAQFFPCLLCLFLREQSFPLDKEHVQKIDRDKNSIDHCPNLKICRKQIKDPIKDKVSHIAKNKKSKRKPPSFLKERQNKSKKNRNEKIMSYRFVKIFLTKEQDERKVKVWSNATKSSNVQVYRGEFVEATKKQCQKKWDKSMSCRESHTKTKAKIFINLPKKKHYATPTKIFL